MPIRLRKGFTLTEVVIVLVIIAILAAASTPAILSMVESGRQRNRMDIARTIYLAAQNRLTELQVSGRLNDFAGRIDEFAQTGWSAHGNVADALGDYFPDGESNEAYVRFIGLDAGTVDPAHPVVWLLAPVLAYQEVLNDAILIEFNIRTGVVLSVFHSDRFANGQGFEYSGANNERDIRGRRGMGNGGYEPVAATRRQGFYGIMYTGSLPDPLIFSVLLFDSHDDNHTPLGYGGNNQDNILFAHISFPHATAREIGENTQFTASFNGIVETFTPATPANLPAGFSRINNPGVGDEGFTIVWILDYVNGYSDALSISRFTTLPYNQALRVSVTGEGRTFVSNVRHPFFSTNHTMGNDFAIRSARHLYNIRHTANMATYTFRLFDDINLRAIPQSSINNFAPLPHLSGTFDGQLHTITNLYVAYNANNANAGLFAITASTATIRRLTMASPIVSGINAGALAGINHGSIEQFTITNPTIMSSYNAGGAAGINHGSMENFTLTSPIIMGSVNAGGAVGFNRGTIRGGFVQHGNAIVTGSVTAGGIVGLNDLGMVTDSGVISDSPDPHVSGSTAGGIIGRTINGTLARILMLAVAPPGNPIVGEQIDQTIADIPTLLYLAGNGLRPELVNYNLLPAAIGTPVPTLGVRSHVASWPGWTVPLMDDAIAISLGNAVFPYPTLNAWQTISPVWPIVVNDFSIPTVQYFEVDGVGVTHAWNIGDLTWGEQRPVVASAGYQLHIEKELLEQNSPHYVRIYADGYYLFTLSPLTAAEQDTTATHTTRTLPLDNLRTRINARDINDRTRPIRLTMSIPGQAAQVFLAYIHPFFAEAIFDNGNPLTEFTIRTPWQMANISYLNTNELTFRQTRSLDFALDGETAPHNGAWFDPAGRHAVVQGNFYGEYIGEYMGTNLRISNVQLPDVQGAYAGLFEHNLGGTIRNLIVSNATVRTATPGTDTYAGASGALVARNSGIITNIIVENPTVVGTRAGGLAGFSDGSGHIENILVRYNTNPASHYIYGNFAGSIVGVNLSPLTNVIFQSAAAASHIRGGNGTGVLGGIAGSSEGYSISRALMLAVAPNSTTHPNQINPIVGTPHYNNPTLLYLMGNAIRPFPTPDFLTINTQNAHVGTGLDTIQIMETDAEAWGGWVNAALQPAINAQNLAISTANSISPYPMIAALPAAATNFDAFPWPIAVSGYIYIRNIFYFERYEVNPQNPRNRFGFHSVEGNQSPLFTGLPRLQNDLTVLEAGYVVLLTAPPSGTLRLFARCAGAPPNSRWHVLNGLNFIPVSDPYAVGGFSINELWYAAIIPLDSLNLPDDIRNHAYPLVLAYGHSHLIPHLTDTDIDEQLGTVGGFVHPHFAKAVFRDDYGLQHDVGRSIDIPYIIRTPWQLSNLRHTSAYLYFRQDRDMDFALDGLPVLPSRNNGAWFDNSNTNAVVIGTFEGRFDGARPRPNDDPNSQSPNDGTFLEIRNVHINAPDSAPDHAPAGLFEHNDGIITRTIVQNAVITGHAQVGAIAGYNTGRIYRAAVEYSTIIGNNRVGGVVGENNGDVTDILFISINARNNSPVGDGYSFDRVGGIVGYNHVDAAVARTFFLAPAPVENNNIFPIIGGAGAADEATDEYANFFLRGHRHHFIRRDNAHLPPYWVAAPNNNYNFDFANPPTPVGGGQGMITNFMDLQWLRAMHSGTPANRDYLDLYWWQPTAAFPYPVLVGMRDPAEWPVGDSPARPQQVDRDEAVNHMAAIAQIGFLNPDFEEPLRGPAGSRFPDQEFTFFNRYQLPAPSSNLDSFIATMGSTTAATNANANLIGGRVTSTWSADGDIRVYTPGVGLHLPGPFYNQGAHGTYLWIEWFLGWRNRPAIDMTGPGIGQLERDRRHVIQVLRPHAGGTGGRTRTDHLGRSPGTNNVTGVYVELNASIPSTLYQIAPTEPGQVVYSFFHAARDQNIWNSLNFFLSGVEPHGAGYRYTTYPYDQPSIIRPATTARGPGGGTALNNPTTRNTIVYGADASIAPAPLVTPAPVQVTPVYFFDPQYCLDCLAEGRHHAQHNCTNTEHTRRGHVRYAYLIDLWVGTPPGTTGINTQPRRSLTGQGQGITFWYNRLGSTPSTGTGATQIPLYGVTDIINVRSGGSPFLLPTQTLVNAAQQNRIGYWDVMRLNETVGTGNQFSEWKQFYGIATIPQGQARTEFAFQSNHEDINRGNLLTGITLQAPGFVSINNHVRTRENQDTTFVQPDERLNVGIVITNEGEIAVDGIVVTYELYPFNVYKRFLSAMEDIIITSGDGTLLNNIPVIQLPDESNGYTLTVDFLGHRLQGGDSITISFQIEVLPQVTTHPGVSTLLFYFDSQAHVSYFYAHFNNAVPNPSDDRYFAPNLHGFTQNVRLGGTEAAYNAPFVEENRHRNASQKIRVFIDPLRLETHVTPQHGINGPWDVTLRVYNTLYHVLGSSVIAEGLINIVIPRGFAVSNTVGYLYPYEYPREPIPPLPPNTIFAPDNPRNTNVPTRITIPGVSIDDDKQFQDFHFTLHYVGDGDGFVFGVHTLFTAEFRYEMRSQLPGESEPSAATNAILSFPQEVVGLQVRTADNAGENRFVFEPEVSDDPEVNVNINFLRILDNPRTRPIISPWTAEPTVYLYYSPYPAQRVTNFDGLTISRPNYTIDLLRAPNNESVIRFTRLNEEMCETVVFYYRVIYEPSQTGANPPSFNLSSRFNRVEIEVICGRDCEYCLRYEEYDEYDDDYYYDDYDYCYDDDDNYYNEANTHEVYTYALHIAHLKPEEDEMEEVYEQDPDTDWDDTPEGFASAIDIVYDAYEYLHDGEETVEEAPETPDTPPETGRPNLLLRRRNQNNDADAH